MAGQSVKSSKYITMEAKPLGKVVAVPGIGTPKNAQTKPKTMFVKMDLRPVRRPLLNQPQAEFVERIHCINCNSTRVSEISHGRFSDPPLVDFSEADPWGECPVPYLQKAEWVLVRCSDCQQMFHKRILNAEWNERRFTTWMSADAIKEFEDRRGKASASKKFDRARGYVEHILRIEKFTRSIRGDQPIRLLDFGCGFGDFVFTCKGFGFEAVGVDRAAPRIKGAVVKIYRSLNDLSGTEPFHAITLFEVLEHLDEPATILKQLAERLMSGGLLIVETPDCEGVSGLKTRKDYDLIHPLEHINAFTHETLISIAERHGFRHIKKRGPVHVTAERIRVLKREAKHLLGRDGISTQLYFHKT
jgi:2-polyprenyl-3-methyl-5-hydroxy-6-metoxy-1,4-benzoquinol methylase